MGKASRGKRKKKTNDVVVVAGVAKASGKGGNG
jgi:hypothetical protein